MSVSTRLGVAAALIAATTAVGAMFAPVRWVWTYAGDEKGMVDGPISQARFNHPTDLELDEYDLVRPRLYVADTYNHRIRLIDMAAPGGAVVSTIAGSGIASHHGGGPTDGPGAVAAFRFPRAIALDERAHHLYVADSTNHRIRCIDLQTPGYPVTTIAGRDKGYVDGPGETACFFAPWGVAVAGNDLYVADTYNHRIRHIDLANPRHPVSTLAGTGEAGYRDGPGLSARFHAPGDLLVDAASSEGWLYVADAANSCVRRIATHAPGTPVSTYAGWPTGEQPPDTWIAIPLIYPAAIARTADQRLVVSDQSTNSLVRIEADRSLTQLVGRPGLNAGYWDGPWLTARFSYPSGLAIARDGTIYVGDVDNHRIRWIR